VVFDKLRTFHTKRGTDKVTVGKLTKKMSMLYLILSVVVLMLQASRACNEQNVQQLASTRLQSDEYAYGADGAYDAYGYTPNPWVSSYYQPTAHVPGKNEKFDAIFTLKSTVFLTISEYYGLFLYSFNLLFDQQGTQIRTKDEILLTVNPTIIHSKNISPAVSIALYLCSNGFLKPRAII
jgi:hypothetical protein